MKKNGYDIFISYRRVGGAQYARILQLMLIQRGYRVFLDYDELTDGVFSEKIKAAISEAPVFIFVLSKGALARCVNEGDWVRQEITLALDHGKHIIPVNPDNEFDGIPEGLPDAISHSIGSHQHSEISFGQALGVTIDLLIQNRLAPTLGKRDVMEHKDEDYDAAKETLRRQDAHNRFMKRLGIICAIIVVALVLGTCFLFWKHQKDKENQQREAEELAVLRSELESKYSAFGLHLNSDLTKSQLCTLDTLLSNMQPVRPDTLWMSQFEFTIGQWYGIKGETFDEGLRYIPVKGKTMGEILCFIDTLSTITGGIPFALPSADEWEYAAHGGFYHEKSLYAGSDHVDSVAWYLENSEGKPHCSDGRQGKLPNHLDLYDMCGNVGEICMTPFDVGADDGRWIVCGGNYTSQASAVTISSRVGIHADTPDPTVGFRIIIRK